MGSGVVMIGVVVDNVMVMVGMGMGVVMVVGMHRVGMGGRTLSPP